MFQQKYRTPLSHLQQPTLSLTKASTAGRQVGYLTIGKRSQGHHTLYTRTILVKNNKAVRAAMAATAAPGNHLVLQLNLQDQVHIGRADNPKKQFCEQNNNGRLVAAMTMKNERLHFTFSRVTDSKAWRCRMPRLYYYHGAVRAEKKKIFIMYASVGLFLITSFPLRQHRTR